MNIAYERFKTKRYITKKWGILLMVFMISIGTASIPVNADSLPATNPVDKAFDINDINDVESPIITVPVSYIPARLGQDYPISITVEDNKGIQDVSVVCFVSNRATTRHFEDKMTQNPTTGKYEYTLSGDQISKNTTHISFFFIATDLVGLKTTGYTPDIDTSSDPNAKPITGVYEIGVYDHIFGRIPDCGILYFGGITDEQVYGEDIHIINPTEYPVIALPTYAHPARSSCDYSFLVTAEDNKGIQEVTIDYNIGDKNFHSLKMTKSWSGRYEFIIPQEQISYTDSTINYTITATNTVGLKTTTDELTVAINPGAYVTTANDFKMSLFAHTDNYIAPKYNNLFHLPEGVSTIKEVLSLNKDTKNVTVAGQVDYFVTDSANPVIQAITGGITYSLYINSSLGDDIESGHQIILSGDYSIEDGFPMLKNITSKKIIGYNIPTDPEIVTIEYLKAHGLNMLGRFVKIEKVKLGTNNPDGLTEITDETGSITLYKSTYPKGIESGDTVNLYAIITCANATVQLRTGTNEANNYSVYETPDGKPTLLIVPTNSSGPRPNEHYLIRVSARDKDGIQEVTISYTVGDKTISNQQLIQNTDNKDYGYLVPPEHISANGPNFSYTITATDTTGLSKSITTTLTKDSDIKITSVSPIPDNASSNKSPTLAIAFTNAGMSPKVTCTLKKDDQTLFTEKTISGNNEVVASDLGTLSAGHYTVIATIVRSEDGKKLTHEWDFTISE